MRYIEQNISAPLLIHQRMCFVFSYSSERARGNQKQVKPPEDVAALLRVQTNFLLISIYLFSEQMTCMCLCVHTYRKLLFGFSRQYLRERAAQEHIFFIPQIILLYSLDSTDTNINIASCLRTYLLSQGTENKVVRLYVKWRETRQFLLKPWKHFISFLYEAPSLFAFPVLLMFLLSAKTHGVPPSPSNLPQVPPSCSTHISQEQILFKMQNYAFLPPTATLAKPRSYGGFLTYAFLIGWFW